MKYSIKRKLLFSFILVILIPILLTLILLIINGYTHINNGQSSVNTFTFINMLIFVLGFITLIVLILLSTMYISKSILLPLKELNKATKNIVNGNLDFQIIYNKEDELGKFCKTFDAMRVQLKNSLEKQAKDENSRKEMIASISHDLRTPIASIKGYVEGLQDGIVKDKKDVDSYLSVIHNKTDKLDRLIDDLFQFSRLELGQLDIHIKIENSQELLEDILNNIHLDLKQSNSELLVQRPFPSVSVKADRHRISQVMDNLIQNAQKFTDENGMIKIYALEKEGYLQIAIEDNGIGICPEDLPHVFERFYRGEKSRSREYGGTGLGLAICKYIIEAHGGKIDVDSVYGEGSIFHFSIPLLENKSDYRRAKDFKVNRK